RADQRVGLRRLTAQALVVYEPRTNSARLAARLSDWPVGAQIDGQDNEDQELAQGAQGASPRKPAGSPQGPRLHHQQVRSALQGAPGLMVSRRARRLVLTHNSV